MSLWCSQKIDRYIYTILLPEVLRVNLSPSFRFWNSDLKCVARRRAVGAHCWVSAAEELPVQRFRSMVQHFRHVNYQSSSSKTGHIPDDLLGSPQKTLIPTVPQIPITPEVREGLGQIVGEVAVAPRRFTKAILDALVGKATSHFQEKLYKVCM